MDAIGERSKLNYVYSYGCGRNLLPNGSNGASGGVVVTLSPHVYGSREVVMKIVR